MSTHAEYDKELAAILQALGDNVRELREAKDVSQEEAAERARLHRTAWGKIETGKREPRFSTMLIIANTLGVTLDQLADGIDPPIHRKPPPANKKSAKPARR